MWSKQERMAAVMNGEPADRPPVTAYRHFPGYEEDAKLIAEAMVGFQKKYDWDWVKINPSAVYYYEPWGNVYDYEHYQGTVPTRVSWAVHEPEQLERFFGDEKLGGVNVTIPYKKDVMALCGDQMQTHLILYPKHHLLFRQSYQHAYLQMFRALLILPVQKAYIP